MAQRNIYEQELDEDLGDNLDFAIGNYVQSGAPGLYDDQLQIDQATLAAMQMQLVQQQALATVPDAVKRFIVHFHQSIRDGNLAEISLAYESGWNRLTEKFYAKTEWPEAETISPLVGDDPIFLILYRELYYRHVYSRLSPNIDDRFHSYENSCELFNYLLNSDGPAPLDLPDQWLWDIIDEFIYQFQSFCTWRSKVGTKTEDELVMLADASQIWSCYSVLNVLYSLIQKSRIEDYLRATQAGESSEAVAELVGEYGMRSLYRMLGYYSIIGLLRVHALLGDYTLALKVMDNVELSQKAPLARVTACHVATYYYVGFCYLMLRRYPDAIRTFVTILNFINRMRQYHTRSYQYDQVNKTGDRMYALLAVCSALSPSRLDDNIMNTVKEKYGEQYGKMTQGSEGIQAFEELFIFACPKFIAANPPPYENEVQLAAWLEEPPADPLQRHLALFLSDVRAQDAVPTLRSFLKLYTSLDAGKLANFLDADEEELVQQMMVMKQRSRSLTRPATAAGSLLEGETVTTSDLDFAIEENTVVIAESTVGRRYGGWFIRNIEHAQRVFDGIRSQPLPISKTAAVTTTVNGQAEKSEAPAPQSRPAAARSGRAAWGGANARRVETEA